MCVVSALDGGHTSAERSRTLRSVTFSSVALIETFSFCAEQFVSIWVRKDSPAAVTRPHLRVVESAESRNISFELLHYVISSYLTGADVTRCSAKSDDVLQDPAIEAATTSAG